MTLEWFRSIAVYSILSRDDNLYVLLILLYSWSYLIIPLNYIGSSLVAHIVRHVMFQCKNAKLL